MVENNNILEQLQQWVIEANIAAEKASRQTILEDKSSSYAVFDGCYYLVKQTAKSDQQIRLCNFIAEIVSEVTKHDGENTEKYFCIRGRMNDGRELAELIIPAHQFEQCDWVVEMWGSLPQITVGPRHKDHFIAAVKEKSNPSQQVIRQHTGWVVENGKHGFISNTGKICVSGLDETTETDLQGILSNYALPKPVMDNPDSPLEVIRDFGGLLPDYSGLVLLSAVFRSTLSHFFRNTLSVYLQGTTGTYKSAISGVLLSFFGKEFNGFLLSDNWTSTANALEKKAFLCKDCVFIVDDFVPRGTANDVNRLHAKAERLFRAQGNAAGRDRLTSNTDIRGAFVPKGLIISSGEDTPAGHSLQARMILVHLSKGEVDTNVLTRLQTKGAQGDLVQHLSNFIYWIAMMADTDHLKQPIKLWLENQRQKYVNIGHARAPDNIASLLLGLHMFLLYAKTQTNLDEKVANTIFQCCETAMLNLAQKQAQSENEVSDSERFISFLRTAISMEKGHFRARSGSAPTSPGNFGWRYVERGEHSDWMPQGSCLGYVHDGEILLYLKSCLAVIKPLSTQIGSHLGISENGIAKALKEAGYIKRHEKGRNTVKMTCEGKRETFLCIDGDKVFDFIGNQLMLELDPTEEQFEDGQP